MDAAGGQDPDTSQILRYIAEGTAGSTGDDFFRDLTRSLAAALGVRWAFASEFTEVRTRVRMLAFWEGTGFVDPFDYALAHTPCEAVLQGKVGFYPHDVQQRFPLHRNLAELGVESYLAVPMTSRAGEVIGHLAAMDTRPMQNHARDLDIFGIFGARAAAELERHYVLQALRKSETRLATILRSAKDAIITVDRQHYVRMFNRAAELAFRCSAEWAIGQPVERFVARRHRKLFDNFMSDENAAAEPRQIWVPEGLTAVRSDGDEFPIEATCSPVQSNGERFYTFILRDINERMQAEAALRELQQANSNLQEELRRRQHTSGLLGASPAMQALTDSIGKVATTDATVLVTGETGSGKELVARAIHDGSARHERAWVAVNCAALPAELIESELFGHERGAFTGATGQRKGRFELADGGSIFLDEVGELSPQAQAKLLRALQEQQFERVGGTAPIRVNVRVIAATNRDLAGMVQDGSFRADLYYRLNVFPLTVPPLRERRQDIPLLARHFAEQFARRMGKPVEGISPLSLERLRHYDWPGNVRELQNVLERALIHAQTPLLEIPASLISCSAEPGEPAPACGRLDEIARQHIGRVLEDCRWTIEGVRGAAAVLGLKPSTLRYRMKQLGIEKPRKTA